LVGDRSVLSYGLSAVRFFLASEEPVLSLARLSRGGGQSPVPLLVGLDLSVWPILLLYNRPLSVWEPTLPLYSEEGSGTS